MASLGFIMMKNVASAIMFAGVLAIAHMSVVYAAPTAEVTTADGDEINIRYEALSFFSVDMTAGEIATLTEQMQCLRDNPTAADLRKKCNYIDVHVPDKEVISFTLYIARLSLERLKQENGEEKFRLMLASLKAQVEEDLYQADARNHGNQPGDQPVKLKE
jgi:hypothetical protein